MIQQDPPKRHVPVAVAAVVADLHDRSVVEDHAAGALNVQDVGVDRIVDPQQCLRLALQRAGLDFRPGVIGRLAGLGRQTGRAAIKRDVEGGAPVARAVQFGFETAGKQPVPVGRLVWLEPGLEIGAGASLIVLGDVAQRTAGSQPIGGQTAAAVLADRLAGRQLAQAIATAAQGRQDLGQGIVTPSRQTIEINRAETSDAPPPYRPPAEMVVPVVMPAGSAPGRRPAPRRPRGSRARAGTGGVAWRSFVEAAGGHQEPIGIGRTRVAGEAP